MPSDKITVTNHLVFIFAILFIHFFSKHVLAICGSCHLCLSLTLCKPIGYSPPCSSVHATLQQDYWNGLPFISPGIFPTQGSNLSLLCCRQVLYHLSHQANPMEEFKNNTCEMLRLVSDFSVNAICQLILSLKMRNAV